MKNEKLKFTFTGKETGSSFESDYDTAIDVSTTAIEAESFYLTHESGIVMGVNRQTTTSGNENAPGYEEGDGPVTWRENEKVKIEHFIDFYMPNDLPLIDTGTFKDALMDLRNKNIQEIKRDGVMDWGFFNSVDYEWLEWELHDSLVDTSFGVENPNGLNLGGEDDTVKLQGNPPPDEYTRLKVEAISNESIESMFDALNKTFKADATAEIDVPKDIREVLKNNEQKAALNLENMPGTRLENRCNFANAKVYVSIQNCIEKGAEEIERKHAESSRSLIFEGMRNLAF